jgi:hypothetical protein
MIRNNTSVNIQGFTPEEYASQWGNDGSYDPVDFPGKGWLFYNFCDEQQLRTRDYLDEFVRAIEYQIQQVQEKPYFFGKNDEQGLRELLLHVKSLPAETKT